MEVERSWNWKKNEAGVMEGVPELWDEIAETLVG